MKFGSFAQGPVAHPLLGALVEPVLARSLGALVAPAPARSVTTGFWTLGRVRSNCDFSNGGATSAANAKVGTASAANDIAAMRRFMMIPFD
jgi:hypothetical protein